MAPYPNKNLIPVNVIVHDGGQSLDLCMPHPPLESDGIHVGGLVNMSFEKDGWIISGLYTVIGIAEDLDSGRTMIRMEWTDE